MKKLFFIVCSILLVGLVSCEAPYSDEQFADVIDTTGNNILTFEVEDVSFKMIYVEGGTFKMGATPEQKNTVFNDEKPVHEVTVSSFYIAETEVTQALWERVMWFTPTQYGSKWQEKYGLGPNYPAYYISWNDCQAFILKLNEVTGKCFRMPTEAEWEYAARGGNKTKGYQYSGSNSASEVGRYDVNKSGMVAQRKHNELGIYDMSGNVWEYCSDYYGPYTAEAQVDPTGAALGSWYVQRGGSWDDYERDCRVARRESARPDLAWIDEGLRLVLSAANTHTITTVVNDDKMGSITGGGEYAVGDTAILKAIPKTGYQFVRWGDDVVENPRSIKVMRNETVTAYFEATEDKVSGVHNGHAFVDLGLPSGVFWATCNVGAETPTNTGYHVAWGETSPKEEYTAESYQHGTATGWMNKYCHGTTMGDYDGICTLEPIDDAATVNWGGSWRMPTESELKELVDECTWTWATRSGIAGYTVAGKNGNSIFLPAAGENFSSHIYTFGTYGHYWSSSLATDTKYSDYAHRLYFSNEYIGVSSSADRERGATVRPVCPPTVGKSYYQINVSSSDETMGSVTGGGTYEANAQAELIASPNAGYMFVNWSDGNTSNPRRITVTQDMNLTANFGPMMYTVNVSVNDETMGSVTGGGMYALNSTATLQAIPNEGYKFVRWNDYNTDNPRVLTIVQNESLTAYFEQCGPPPGEEQGHEYIDLGLPSGTLWATYNAGATTPYEYGTYKNHLNWKGWEWPTKEDYEELKKYCTSEQILEGRKYIGPNGNSILFPYAGYCYQHSKEPTHVGTDAYYWTSSMYATGAYNYDNEGYFFAPTTNQIVILYTFDYACPVRYVYRPQ